MRNTFFIKIGKSGLDLSSGRLKPAIIRLGTYTLQVLCMGLVFNFFACESAEDISKGLDHQVPACKTLTLTYGSQTKVIDDAKVSLYYWGVVPQTNLETIVFPTITVPRSSTFSISVALSDNDALKNLTLEYSDWSLSESINFANPIDNIPLTPKSYTYSTQVTIPADAVNTPWIDNYYFNDGFNMKVTQSYHKLTLTVVDVNMNQRIIPIYVKVE